MNKPETALQDPPTLARVRVPKTAEVVAQSLRSQIVRGVIPEGAALPSEAELMSQFGVSRPSLREAFRILESEQLIEVRRGARGGARATRPSVDVAANYLRVLMQFDAVELRDVFQARALIEPLALHLLASHRNRVRLSQRLLRHMEEIYAREDRTDDEKAEDWIGFNLMMFELAGNKTLFLIYTVLTEVFRAEVKNSYGSDGSAERQVVRAVRKVMTMVEEGKGSEAANFWHNQLSLAGKAVARRHKQKTLTDMES